MLHPGRRPGHAQTGLSERVGRVPRSVGSRVESDERSHHNACASTYMDHRQELEALAELALTGNMRRAAEALGVSQSTLSDVIARMESAYGATLFERDRRGSHPTVYGKVVVDAAVRALRLMDEAHREIGLIKGSASGRLAIGAEAGLIEPYLTSAIALGLKRYPNLRFRLQAVDSGTLVQEVREKRIDFFFAVRPDVPTAGLELREIGVIDAVPFVRPGHPLAGSTPRTLGKIMAYPIVQGPGPRWFIRRIGDELRSEAGAGDAAQRDAAVIVNDFGAVRAIVRETDAVGFATSAMLHAEVANGAFVQLRLPAAQAALLKLPILIGTLSERALPPAAQVLIAELESVVASYAGDRKDRSA